MSDENADVAVLDRGDNLPVAEAPEAKVAADEAAVAKELDKVEEEKAAKEAQPRDPETGKFAKKERDETEKPIGIPKTVFDERINAERAARLAAEQRAAELEAKITQAAHNVDIEKLESDITGLEKQHTKLMMEGEAEKAAEVMRDIRLKEREIQRINTAKAEAERDNRNAQERAAAEEKTRVLQIVADMQSKYPELDDASPQFNKKLVNFVLAEQSRLINEERMSPSAALQAAIDDAMELRGTGKTSLTEAETASSKDKATERKAAAVAKNVAAAAAQPGSMKEVGIDSDRAGTNRPEVEDAALMTYEEFAALPESTKAKMRGDFI